MTERHLIYVVSDSLGETAESVVWAAASQFGQMNVEIEQFSFVRDTKKIDDLIVSAKKDHAFVVFTLVMANLSRYFTVKAKEAGIQYLDLMSEMVSGLSNFLGKQPLGEPGLSHQLDEDYFRKIEAIEFAVKYDDCKDQRGILFADIVLIGISRTSKTPLSQFLAVKKYKVANVPIVPEVDPPEELFKIDPKRCFGLKISTERLNSIRMERLAALGLDGGANYANSDRINEELRYFDEIVQRVGCRVIDVSLRAVEETANEILKYMSEIA
ncbi:pyruvate, water dikinase regulatory protein [Sporolactobacillus putidus]|uniref:Putative pyruvate, phosphate dikinase regulatory protein n=1 Tax=Sporolactobacillus putidus TaxID=492735 RepID=A0A917RVL9_9BACL|nr:pyruvate, water dikinase regulatory protein [Sporolactobacillus putidus]GGL40206.1 putative pyruvate, phosphate dikinase regulatory protein [Sporolactobacillus putidus]